MIPRWIFYGKDAIQYVYKGKELLYVSVENKYSKANENALFKNASDLCSYLSKCCGIEFEEKLIYETELEKARSSVNKIDKAINNLNYKMMYNNEMYASLSDFFDELSLRDLITPSSEQVGWNIDSRIEVKKDKTGVCEFTDEPYILIEFVTDPTNNYQKIL